ncbi:MAG TPA: glycosyltransferase [Ktedonobacterales bacterium]|nr:glycosyltransferase [Ktedonobacterales bacterium]
MMARILAYTTPARGHLFPLVPILDELRRRGHQIALRTLASQVPLMQARGFEAAPISAQVEAIALEDWRVSDPRESLKYSVRGFCARAEYDAPDLQRAIAEERPDALIVDINSWGGLAAAEAWGGPWAALCPYPLTLRSPDAPPFGPGLPPARGPLGRLRDRLLRPLVLGTIEKTMLPPLNGVRAQLGLAPLAEIDEMFRRPPLLLYLTAEPFEYHRRDWPASVVMVGPCAWDPPADPPAWLAEITGPIVLVTTSSEFQNDGRLIQTAFDALADEPVTVIATLPAGDPERIHPPANARLERFIPHSAVLDRAACAITHGGMGATQKALARGVPVCAVPFGRDQLEVARRVEVAGAGTRLPASRLSPDRLRAKVREAMAMAERARRVAAAFAAAGGPTAAAATVETRLLTPKPSAIRSTS